MEVKDVIRLLNLDKINIGKRYDPELYQPMEGITVTGVWKAETVGNVDPYTYQNVQFSNGICVDADASYVGLIMPDRWYMAEEQYGRQGGKLAKPEVFSVELTKLELERMVAALDMAREYLGEHLMGMSVWATIYMETYFNDADSDHKQGLDTMIFNDFAKLKKKFEDSLKD